MMLPLDPKFPTKSTAGIKPAARKEKGKRKGNVGSKTILIDMSGLS